MDNKTFEQINIKKEILGPSWSPKKNRSFKNIPNKIN